MHKLRIKAISKDDSLSENKKVLTVELEIVLDKEVVETRKLSFPMEIKEKDLKAELAKYLETYKADLKLAEVSKVNESREKNADKIIENLVGAEI